MSLGSNSDNSDLILEDSTKIPSSEEYIPLGITIDNKLTFYSHLKQLCKKVANKLNALTSCSVSRLQSNKTYLQFLF